MSSPFHFPPLQQRYNTPVPPRPVPRAISAGSPDIAQQGLFRFGSLDRPRQEVTSKPLPVEDSSIDHRISRLEDHIEKAKARINLPFAHVPAEVVHSDISKRPLNPHGHSDTDLSIILDYQFGKGGTAALARALRLRAVSYQRTPGIEPSRNYDVISDVKNQVDIMNMLSTQDFDFIRHLIRGDLVYQYYHDSAFRGIVATQHTLEKVPGCYVQAVVLREYEAIAPDTGATQTNQTAKSQINPLRGHWLTAREILEFYTTAKRYLHGPNKSAADIELARKIDQVYAPDMHISQTEYETGDRKYIKKFETTARKGNQHKFEEWLKVWKNRFVFRIQALVADEQRTGSVNPLLDEPFRYTIFEVGYGVDVLARATQHNTHESSNSLFTFYQAVLCHLFDQDRTRFEVIRFMTNRLSHHGQDAFHHALISDVAQTMLAGAEWHQGGLNPTPGGGAGVRKNILEKCDKVLQKNFEQIYQRGLVYRINLKKTKEVIEQARKDLDRWRRRVQIKQEQRKEHDELVVKLSELEVRASAIKDARKLMKVQEVFTEYERCRDKELANERTRSLSVSDDGMEIGDDAAADDDDVDVDDAATDIVQSIE